MNFFIGAFYDGVYLLGLALNETLTEGGNIRDGMRLTRKMWNRDFLGGQRFSHDVKHMRFDFFFSIDDSMSNIFLFFFCE